MVQPDHPTETVPGDSATLEHRGEKLEASLVHLRLADLDYSGSPMPPPDAVAAGQVQPLSDEDRLTLVRWIDLGCPIDLDSPSRGGRGYGWLCDDQRPTLTLALPAAGANSELRQILVGMHDYHTGLDQASFHVAADFSVDGQPVGSNLAGRFQSTAPGVWRLLLEKPIAKLARGTLTVSVRDRQGNIVSIVRTLSVESTAE